MERRHIDRVSEGPPHRGGASLIGSDTFSIQGGGTGHFALWCDPCLAGDIASAGGSISLGTFGAGSVMYQGEQFNFNFFRGPFGGGELLFIAGTFTLPETPTEPLLFRSPFVLLPSLITVEDARVEGQTTSLEFLLSGRGIATLTYGTSEPMFGRTTYRAQSVTFEFSENTPVPEPASVLLLVGGLGAAWLKHRTRC